MVSASVSAASRRASQTWRWSEVQERQKSWRRDFSSFLDCGFPNGSRFDAFDAVLAFEFLVIVTNYKSRKHRGGRASRLSASAAHLKWSNPCCVPGVTLQFSL